MTDTVVVLFLRTHVAMTHGTIQLGVSLYGIHNLELMPSACLYTPLILIKRGVVIRL